jgi:hypothetical protein
MTSADAVLADATGSTDPHLVLAFVAENLSFWTELAGKPFVLPVTEVRAWRRENEFRIRAGARWQRVLDPAAAAQLIFELLNGPPKRPWWESHRRRHGAPPFPSSVGSSPLMSRPASARGRAPSTGADETRARVVWSLTSTQTTGERTCANVRGN